MQVTETSSEGLRREFTVVVPKDDIETRLVARLTEVGQTVNVPGFRPGKIPVSVLRKRFGEAVRGEILERTIQDTIQKTIEERDLRPAMEPKIDLVAFADGADLEYTLTVDVLPEIAQPDFSAIELERLVVEVPEEDVDSAVKRVAEQQKTFVAEEGRVAASGDQLLMNFLGRIDGEAFDGGAAEGFELELGSGRFIPGFEEQLIGAKPGEKREVKVSFPDDYGAENLKGKDAVFDVDVTEVRAPGSVEIDDAFAKAVGAEDLAALKTMIREQIGTEYQQVSQGRLKRALLDELAEVADFEVPPGLLDQEFNDIWKQVEEARERDALDEDDKGKSDEELQERYRNIALRRIRLGLLLAEIGRANELTVTQDDLNRAMAEQARRFPGQEAQVMQFYQQNPQAMQELQAPIFEDKIVNYMLELVKVTERSVTTEELLADPDAEGGDSEEGETSGKPAKAKKKKSAKGKAK
ncbi:MAG: trigger factor [Rhodospirillaceae bacterium]